MEVSRRLPRAVAYVDFVVATVVAVIGLYLVTSPLHPIPGDSHGGLMAVFPGLLLGILAWLAYVSGKLLLRGHIWGWPLQGLVLAGLGLFIAALLAP